MLFKNAKYRALFNRYKNDIYGYALYMLHDAMEAEDVAQEVLIKTWDNMGKFDMTKAKSWILKTTHNLCIDVLRKRQRLAYSTYSLQDNTGEYLSVSDNGHDPAMLTDINLTNEEINNKIKLLPEKLRSVFLLYEIHGLKYKEISDAMNIPVNSVKVYLLRARKKLQEELKEYEPERI